MMCGTTGVSLDSPYTPTNSVAVTLVIFLLISGKKVLIVYAHQEPKSLNGSLKTVAVEELSKQGCRVAVSDLYEMQFEPRTTRKDIVGKYAACC